MSNRTSPRTSKAVLASLWLAQALVFLSFAGGAVWKVTTPIPVLATKMPWMGQVSPSFLYMTAFFDFLGGVGIFLPSLTRIKPTLTPIAALGCIALMVCAVIFHVSRGESASTPFNFFMIALSLFVFWGRTKKAPITPRS